MSILYLFKESEDKLSCIDGLKGIGACSIAFVWHYQHFAPQEGSPFYRLFVPFYDMGDLMVEVFFMLSGLCMVLGYEKKILNGEITFAEYMGKRLKKLFPIMLFTLLVTLLLQYIYARRAGGTFQYSNFDVYHFILNLLGVQDGILGTDWSFNAPSWYVSVLIWCYAGFYFIVSKSKQDEILTFRYILAALAGGAVIVLNVNFPLFNLLMGRGFACFFIGAILAVIYRQRAKLYSQRMGYLCLLFLLIIGTLVGLQGYGVLGNIRMAMILGIAPALILGILFVPWLSKLFTLRPLVYLGKISLSIYLWHFPVQCMWKIADVYGRLDINYSRRSIWLMYVASVLITAGVYEKFLAQRVQGIGKFFVKEF